ncbi:hypothetical protein AB4084_35710 [Lysobacter sp. 2RAB21]
MNKDATAVAPFEKGGGDREADAGDLLLLLLLHWKGKAKAKPP